MKGDLVSNWMTKDPITVSGSVTMPDAYWIMVNNHIKRLLVVENGALIGIVTIDDLQQKIPWTAFSINAMHANEMLSKYPVRMIMTTNVVTTSPDTPLYEAAKLMIEKEISTLPVLDENKVVGIITESDIFKAFVELSSE
jgi:CBS domain-containing protein